MEELRTFLPSFQSTIAAGLNCSAALSQSGRIYVWGSADRGQLGTYQRYQPHSPYRIDLPHRAIGVFIGNYQTLVLTSQGKLYGAGAVNLGRTNESFLPVQPNLSMSTAAVGADHVVAVTPEGDLYTWGSNRYGQLGTGASSGNHPATLVPLPYRAIQVAAGASHTAIVTNNGWLYTCGSGAQLGAERWVKYPLPQHISLPQPVRQVAAGYAHTIILLQDGGLYVCGDNAYGQLGFSSESEIITLTALSFPHRVVRVAAGRNRTAVITAAGDLYVCGENEYGELRPRRPLLAQLEHLPLPEPVVEVACGDNHLLIKTVSNLYACGLGGYGQLGTGGTRDYFVPTRIILPVD